MVQSTVLPEVPYGEVGSVTFSKQRKDQNGRLKVSSLRYKVDGLAERGLTPHRQGRRL
jgi:hypothetical protein